MHWQATESTSPLPCRKAATQQAKAADATVLISCPVRPLTRPATALLARLLPSRPEDGPEKAARAAEANSAALRRHFAELTAAFLAPFSSLFQLVGLITPRTRFGAYIVRN